MKNEEYKRFKETVKEADEKNPIWWAGFLWINLTKRQARDIIEILKEQPFIKDVEVNGIEAYEIPSGLAIHKAQ